MVLVADQAGNTAKTIAVSRFKANGYRLMANGFAPCLRATPEFLGADPADIARTLAPYLQLPILPYFRTLIVALLDIGGLADSHAVTVVQPEFHRTTAGVAVFVGGL